MQWTHEHLEVRKTLKRYIDEKINPYVDAWEEEEIFPAHQVFKGLGDLGLLGLTKPEAYGGSGLDYSYSLMMAETLGISAAAACPWPLACRPICARPRWHALAATDCASSSWLPPSRGRWWAA
jgi:citronellyl-CoA dehydrogenase